ncbi:MAG: leucyl/phenylalanyl-tRNA--protein transferase [Acidimicrobiia bacterium]|nr:leucyl/phenylalanyl-tRNA--protein transferase [Acidimicrobiia bacterium]
MPSKFQLPDPRTVDDDIIAVGGDLTPGTILQAYRRGMFPMHLPDGRLAWWSPRDRAILPLDQLKISRSLRQSVRRFTLSVDEDFEPVIDSCANPERPDGWINREIRDAYVNLHQLGWAHSIEVWESEGRLAGGLYGVVVGGLFAGESMFYEVSDASKVALVHLVVMLSDRPGCLLDVQWLTPHLERMGAVVIGREEYLKKLPAALAANSPFDPAG